MSLTLGIIASSRGNIVPPLDTYGGAAAAYSTRLLSSAYGGSAVRVRRSFDNAEQDIGFSGGAIDETALMNFVGYQNLYLQSQTFTAVNWNKIQSTVTSNAGTDPFGGNTATRWISDVGATTHNLHQSNTLTVGQSYNVSFYVRSNTGSSQLFRLFGCDSIISSDLTATNDWQRFQFSFVATSNTAHGITRPSSNAAVDLLIYGAQLNIGTTAQPYQVTTSAARSGDGFVTKWYTQDSNGENLILQSQTFENGYWVKVQSSVSTNATTAPDGTLTAEKLIDNTVNDAHYIVSNAFSITGSLTYTYSFYVKAAEITAGGAALYSDVPPYDSNLGISFNLTTGTVTPNPFGAAVVLSTGISNVGNGWYRIWCTGLTNRTNIHRFNISLGAYLGTGTQGFFIWGAQLSQSTWLQGYQATTTSQVFRRDASQSTAANQPRIVGGGVIERENGKAAIRFDGVDDFLNGTDIALPVSSIFATVVQNVTNATGYHSIYSRGSSSNSSRDALLHIDTIKKTVSMQRANGTLFPTADAYTAIQNYLVASGIFTGSQLNAFADSISGTSVLTSISGTVSPVTLIGATSEFSTSLIRTYYMGGEIGEIIVYNSDRTATRADIERNIGAYYQTHWTGASSGLLDQFGGAAAAYSLRNLSSSYRGPLIRVRRSSDNAETDIGGTYNGDLDVASLLSFTGGQNLLLNSEDFTQGSWSKFNIAVTANATIAPDGTLTADKLTETATTSFHNCSQGFTISNASTIYSWSIYIKAAERSKVYFGIYFNGGTYPDFSSTFDLLNGSVYINRTSGANVLLNSSIQSVGNGWYRCSVTGVTNITGSHAVVIQLNNDSWQNNYLGVAGSGVYLWGAQLNTGILQPYIPTTTAAVNGANAFVTKWYTQDNNYQNLVLQSQTFENANWTKSNTSITQDSTAAPDGTLTADTLVENTALAGHQVGSTPITTTTNQTYTCSVYAKLASGSRYLGISPVNAGSSGNNAVAVFDLSNGTFLGSAIPPSGLIGNLFTASDVSIQSAGNGWWRCSVRLSVAGTIYYPTFRLYNAFSSGTGTGTEYTGDGTSGVFLWGAQLNEGTLVPYTATTTTASQRRDAIQATAANQPRIVNAGGVESEGNRPAVFWTDGTNMRLTASFQPIPSPQSFFAVNRIAATSGINQATLFDSYNDVQNVYYFKGLLSNNVFAYADITVLDGPTNPIPVQYLTNVIHDTVTNVYDNNLLTISGSVSTNSLSGLSIGNLRGNPNPVVAGYDWFGDIQELVVYPSNLATRLAVNSNINSYYRIYWQGNGTALLDSFSGASAAYSLRNLSSAYTGPLIRVRRSNDNVERDIYGTFGGDLDIASLVAFVGANSGFVTTWYDQSGNARHATQTTAANQPRIVNAGVVDTQNGKPSVFFSGANNVLDVMSGLDILQNVPAVSMYSVLSTTSTSLDQLAVYITTASSGASRFLFGSFFSPTNGYVAGGRRLDSDSFVGVYAAANTNTRLMSSFVKYSSSDIYFYSNGSLASSSTSFQTDGNTQNTASALFRLGSNGSFTQNWNGRMQEIILYNNDQESSRVPAETNINNYYKIY